MREDEERASGGCGEVRWEVSGKWGDVKKCWGRCGEVLGEEWGSVRGGLGKCRGGVWKCGGRCGGCGEAIIINLEL